MKHHLQYLRSWRLLWVLIGLSTSNVIGQNLPVTYRFNGTNAFTTMNYIVQYSTLNIVIQDLVTGRGKSFWPETCPWPDQNSRKGQDQAQFTCWVRIWESGSQNAGYFAFATSIGSLNDLITWSAFGKHENSSLLKNQSRVHGFVWKTMQAWLDGKIFFSHTSACNFWRPL